MCGRLTLFTPPERLARIFEADLEPELLGDVRPRYNVPPTARIFGIAATEDPSTGGAPPILHRHLGRYRWGLVPSWAKDPTMATKTFNARGETVASKPSFRSAFLSRRLVVVADGFYEWKPVGKARTPYYFTRADGAPLAFAGLWETWRPPDDPETGERGEEVRSCTIITTEAGPDMGDIHHRIPVILELDALDEWLDPELRDKEALGAMLVAPPAGTVIHHQVDRRVGNVRNDGVELTEPTGDVGLPGLE